MWEQKGISLWQSLNNFWTFLSKMSNPDILQSVPALNIRRAPLRWALLLCVLWPSLLLSDCISSINRAKCMAPSFQHGAGTLVASSIFNNTQATDTKVACFHRHVLAADHPLVSFRARGPHWWSCSCNYGDGVLQGDVASSLQRKERIVSTSSVWTMTGHVKRALPPRLISMRFIGRCSQSESSLVRWLQTHLVRLLVVDTNENVYQVLHACLKPLRSDFGIAFYIRIAFNRLRLHRNITTNSRFVNGAGNKMICKD
jgi:hypothetical protein